MMDSILRNLRFWLPILGVAIGGGMVGAALWQRLAPAAVGAAPQAQFYPASQWETQRQAALPAEVPGSFAGAAQAATESVVFIQTLTESRRQADDFWSMWDFFGSRGPISGAGSGVIIAADGQTGYIVTNHHVVQNADRIDVSLRNKHTYPATLVGSDPNTDLALLKIEAGNLTPLVLANSDQLSIGDWVLAIGNPFNLQYTVTAGIVSAKGRNINILNTEFPIESFIQTDAAINPGNSGGALVNTNGQLVGINAAIATRTGSYNGYGFAIPANIVRKVVADLKEFGSVQRAFAGAEVLNIDSQVGKDLPNGDYSGVMVSKVEADGPAAKAGLQPGDVILSINEASINTKAEFLEHLSYYRPGETISVTTRREGKVQTRRLALVNEDGGIGPVMRRTYSDANLGVDISPLTKAEQARYDVKVGYRLTNLRGRMASLGLPEGFIVLRINGYEPEKPEEVSRLLLNARGRVVVEGIQPNGQRIAFSIVNY